METELRQLHIIKQDGILVVIDPDTGEVMGRGVWQTAKAQPAKKAEPKFYPNKYAAKCRLCGVNVPEMTGQWEYKVGVKHIKCPPAQESKPTYNRFRAPAWDREPPDYD